MSEQAMLPTASSPAADGPEARDAVPAIRLTNLVKTFGEVNAVDGVDLDIRQGEFFSMLGPSGSGKTTVLRMIAGFELPTSGTIELDGVDVSTKAPFERDVSTVFQDYALFPHMSLIDNVAYGLRVRGMAKAERRERAAEALDRVQLGKFLDRRPAQLSGGQRQRVALARALVVEPKVLLLDEPLGALDLKLRQQMQIELKELQRSLGITFIFVTHDQEEALTMSDRIGVFSNGRIAQIGSAHEIYQRPLSGFVANFVGTSNILPSGIGGTEAGPGASFVLRPERLRLDWEATAHDAGPRTLSGQVTSAVYIGHATQVHIALDAGPTVVALIHEDVPDTDALEGRRVTVSWAERDAVWLPEAA